MRILLDTNVLVRLADRASSHHAVAKAATLKLESDGQQLCLVPQIVYEYWVVVTRPIAENGLGMSADEANRAVDMQLDLFTLLLY